MHSPLAIQALAHFSDSAGPLPKRRMSSTPDTTAFGSASPSPAGAAIGQTSKQAPHLVQASSMSSTRAVRADSNPTFSMSLRIAQNRGNGEALSALRYLHQFKFDAGDQVLDLRAGQPHRGPAKTWMLRGKLDRRLLRRRFDAPEQ